MKLGIDRATQVGEQILPEMDPDTRILILDDDALMLEFSKRLLAKRGYTYVVTTDCPDSCISLAMDSHFDVILVDYVLGDITGAEVAAQIRENGNNSSRIFGLTANLRSDVSERCMSGGMNGVLEKPLKVQELASAYLH